MKELKTVLDLPDDALDASEQSFVANVRKHGWQNTTIAEDAEGPGFSYTTGFWVAFGSPEVIVFSLGSDAHDTLWSIYNELKDGRQYPVGVRIENFFTNVDAYLMPVSRERYPEHLGWCRWFHMGDDVPCVQLVWPDRHGNFPWEPSGSADFRRLQPDLSPDGWVAALRQ